MTLGKGSPALIVNCRPIIPQDIGARGEAPAWKREIELHTDDLIAAAQILAWIAMPHRPQPGVHLLEQWYWARRRYRKEPVPELPFALRKRNRLELQLAQFNMRVLDGLRAGQWFNRRVTASIPGDDPWSVRKSLGASTRRLASLYGNTHGIEQSNAIRAIWSKRKPVLHLASAAGEVLAALYADENRQGFDLERTVFWPNWVADTIERVRQKADFAAQFSAFSQSDFYRFHRDKN